jgi:plastocyanin
MHKRIAVFAILALSALAACGGGGSSGGVTPPGLGSGTPTSTPGATATPAPTASPTIAPLAVGVALPTSEIGSLTDPTYGEVGGYTQSTYSQTLAFPVGSTISISNLSATPHTFDVVSTTGFPANPTLTTTASGGPISATWSSGILAAGTPVSVALSSAGTYYFGCAFHYLSAPQMRDVLIVSNSAVPGPQATPQAGATAPPSGGGGCVGYYC